MMYLYEGKRVRILNDRRVLFDGRKMGTLVRTDCDDDETGWWNLEYVNHRKFPITDDVHSRIADLDTFQEIGEYLDCRLKDFCRVSSD